MQTTTFVRIVLSSDAWVDHPLTTEEAKYFSLERFIYDIKTRGYFMSAKAFVPYHAIRNVVLLEETRRPNEMLS